MEKLPGKLQKTASKKLLNILGPGLTTGAADDDPSGIGTYSQTGAQFGYGQLWTAFYLLPLMIGVQEACARIGLVTGKGIAGVVKQNYNKAILYMVISLVVVANVINIGADIGAMAAAAHLLIPLPTIVLTCLFVATILILEIFLNYQSYSRILKWLTLALISYPLTVLIVDQPWLTILKASFIPHVELSFAFLFIITGVLGTTISPYMFFWEASQEVEELKRAHRIKAGKPQISPTQVRRLRIDNALGMIFSEITTWSILVVAATVLHQNGIRDVKTASDAAKALEPLVHSFPHAGFLAKLIFSTGIIGLGLLAVPVLSGSAAYAISEAFDWKSGLNLKLKRAHGFYGVITIATIIGVTINFIGIDPVKALVYSAVLNGVAAVPLLFVISRIAASEKIMGKYKSGPISRFFVWLSFIAMTAAVIAMLYAFFQ